MTSDPFVEGRIEVDFLDNTESLFVEHRDLFIWNVRLDESVVSDPFNCISEP